MARKFLIDLNQNDTLEDVVRKANHNFRAVSINILEQQETNNVDADELLADLVAESNDRIAADTAINDRIDNISSNLVTGVKGDAEATYRHGNVSIGDDDLGLYELTDLEVDAIWTQKLRSAGM